jgi:beta-galactosidase
LKIGVAYYPEHNEMSQWSTDLEMIRSAGIGRVRIAEFAWSRMEPEEGDFQWDWLDRFIDLAMEYKVEVVLCTPTAVPPIWLVERFPEVLPVNEEGRRNVFGGRQHRCYNTSAYVTYSLRITEQLAKRYGNHPNVVAWQLDNEFGGEQKRCYCVNCGKAFQVYLAERYGTVEQLNKRWGTVFWSQEYKRFGQIDPPMIYKADLGLKHHPSLELDFTRFSSRSIVAFSRLQTVILRNHSSGRPISTNVYAFTWGDNLDWIDLTADLDAIGIDVYSEHVYENAFYADFMYSLKPGNAWFLEFGTGGEVGQWMGIIDQVRSRRTDWLFIFKYKPFPFGQEQGLKELVTSTGEPTDKYYALQQLARPHDIDEALQASEPELEYASANAMEGMDILPASGVGLYFHFESSWVYTISQWGNMPHKLKYTIYFVHSVYRSVFREDRSHRIVYSADQLAGLHTLIVPRHIVYDPELEMALLIFMDNGGTVIATSDLFQKNSDNVFLTQMPKMYSEVLGRSSYITDSKTGDPIVQRASRGKGALIIVHQDATFEEWQSAATEYGK